MGNQMEKHAAATTTASSSITAVRLVDHHQPHASTNANSSVRTPNASRILKYNIPQPNREIIHHRQQQEKQQQIQEESGMHVDDINDDDDGDVSHFLVSFQTFPISRISISHIHVGIIDLYLFACLNLTLRKHVLKTVLFK